MELYHGSKEIVEYPEIRITKYTKDFSWGFYCTKDYTQAVRRANRGSTSGVVNVYDYVENPGLNILRFEKMDGEWLDFIAACRGGEVHGYDIVEGPMADDAVWNYVNAYLNGDIPKEVFLAYAELNHPTHQLSFHTMKALKCLTFVRGERTDE